MPLVIEQLECRTLFDATLSATPPAVYVLPNSAPTSINLNQYLTDPSVTGSFVVFQTNEGTIPMDIFTQNSQVAATATNFLSYVNSSEYDNTFFHRVIKQGIGIVQGGTYTTSLNPIPTASPIALQAALPNSAGTIAMARTTDPNSATSGFFFNAIDNTSNFTGSNQYAVFGRVLYNGMNAVNAIYNLPQPPSGTPPLVTSDNQPQPNVPVINYSGGTPTASNLVVIQSATATSPLTFGASTDNNQLVVPAIAPDGTLTLTYVPGATGTAHIDINGQDYGGHVVTTSFTVNVGALPTTTATAGKGQARIIRFTDPNGVAGTVTLAGPGTATLTATGGGITTSTKGGVETVTGTPQSVSISTTGTSAGSVLNVGGAVTLAGIGTDANIGSISASRATLNGGLSVAGTVGSINLASAGSGTITISGTGRSTVLRIATATGEGISDTGTIGSINTGSWTGGGLISAPAINRIAATHEFSAILSAGSVGQVTAGSITESSAWSISGTVARISAGSISNFNLTAGAIGTITDRGTADSDIFSSLGNIGAVSAQTLSNTQIDAAVGATDNADNLATQFSTNTTIGSVSIGRGGFSNSVINGATLRHVNLGAVSSSNNGTPFGVASSDIVFLTAIVDGKRVTVSRATAQSDVTAALTKAGVTPNDLVIRIV